MRKIGEIENTAKASKVLKLKQLIKNLVRLEVQHKEQAHFVQFELELIPQGQFILSKIEVYGSASPDFSSESYDEALLSGIKDWLEEENKAGFMVEDCIMNLKEIVLNPEDMSPVACRLALSNALHYLSSKHRENVQPSNLSLRSLKVVDLSGE